MARIPALSRLSPTPSPTTETSKPPSLPAIEPVAPVVASTTSNWFVRQGEQLLVVRRVPCVVCCPRKRPRCPVCLGTGIREAEYEISHEDAKALVGLLQSALGEVEKAQEK